ncbi:2-C-methyl-D-erythritol 4-phosphate cytidylyltransferase [Nocardioides sp.]|uniref:2-C-methyl-D-erythritol 4-phosphate cytidylyltransferase n=1 Tax=Nocardioides sp. TaxID=35761 RepID=UPI002ED1D741
MVERGGPGARQPVARPCVVALLAGGTGTRIGSETPKQLLTVAGRTLLEHALRAFHAHPGVDAITLVMAPGHLDEARSIVRAGRYHDKVTAVVEGGATRSDSTRAALATLPARPCHVLVHDAARPLVTARIITDCLAALAAYPAVNVAIESVDTLVTVDQAGFVVDSPPRASLRRVQTPQGFHSEVLIEAYARAAADPDFTATDDCSVVARYLPDQPIVVVAGDERNLKVTTPVDLEIAAALLRDGSR